MRLTRLPGSVLSMVASVAGAFAVIESVIVLLLTDLTNSRHAFLQDQLETIPRQQASRVGSLESTFLGQWPLEGSIFTHLELAVLVPCR